VGAIVPWYNSRAPTVQRRMWRSMMRTAPRTVIRNSIRGRASRFLEGWANARFVKAFMIDGLAIPGG
jgi:hypothetical protein